MNDSEPVPQLSRTERKRLRRLQREEQSHSPETRANRWTQASKKRVFDALTIIGGIVALLSFLPAFSVSREPPLDPSDVLTGQFVIRYESPIPVADVDPVCGVEKLENDHYVDVVKFPIRALGFRVPIMWQGDAITVPCAITNAFGLGKIVSGDITIRVRFRPILVPWFLHWRTSERDFRFVTIKQSDGNLRWIPETQHYNPAQAPAAWQVAP
jgi:hypothetical protein